MKDLFDVNHNNFKDIMDFSILRELNPLYQTLLATLFTWSVTAVGASTVFLTKKINRKVFEGLLGFSAGVMLSASFFSLLLLSINQSVLLGSMYYWFPVVIGFALGALSIRIADMIIRSLYTINTDKLLKESSNGLNNSLLLLLAITIHNIPEGLAIGVAFGAASLGIPGASTAAAISLTIGIWLQTFQKEWQFPCLCEPKGYPKSKAFGMVNYLRS